MQNVRRIGAFVAATLAALTLTSVAAAPASAATRPQGPQPVNQLLGSVRNNQTSWVNVWWKTDRTICDAKLVVWGNSRVDVDYPGNTARYTAFSHGSTLTRRGTDYTAVKVTPHYNGSSWVLLAATMTYNYCGRHARTESKTTGFLLTVRS
jgi:hypothetical protein